MVWEIASTVSITEDTPKGFAVRRKMPAFWQFEIRIDGQSGRFV